MKQKTVDKVVTFYEFWSATFLAISIFMIGYRIEAFYTWWISLAALMIFLMANILYLSHVKKKISETRLKEIIHERNERLSRRASRLGVRYISKSKRYINNSHEAIYIDKK